MLGLSQRSRRTPPLASRLRATLALAKWCCFSIAGATGAAYEARVRRLGIELPHEQSMNEYCDLAINFRYFFIPKTMFVK